MKVANLAKARILVTNDDGIHAPGLEALVEIATQLSSDVWIVAPEVNQSGAGHSLRCAPDSAAGRRAVAVDGTPTDAVLMGVKVLKSKPPTLVLSGVAAAPAWARRDLFRHRGGRHGGHTAGIPRSPSASARPGSRSTGRRPSTTADVIRRVCALGWGKNVLISLNFPPCPWPASSACRRPARAGTRSAAPSRMDPRGLSYY
jgi:5'-nucleotidase